ncbi:MAG: BrnA antitoxin family protein [Alphaproteobacteria bacterium]|nr:BrnA antitoxin family protein [Alphaproteobacteria bacterium]
MTGKKSALGSDLARVDAHVIQPHEYEEIPEWTDEMFARADHYRNGKLISRGRPCKENPKLSTTIRLDADVVAHFRAEGPGWQTRINQALRKAAGM